MQGPDVDITIYYVEGYEIHKVGHPHYGAAVQYNLKYEKKTLVNDGIEYTADVPVRGHGPYVSLVSIRQFGNKPVLDEDKPMAGGAGANEARLIGLELIAAADYCDWLKSQE